MALVKRWRMARTERELQEASEHVNYEVTMMVATMSFLSRPVHPGRALQRNRFQP